MDNSSAFPRPIPPVVWGEICLTFPQDFPMEEIDRAVGICATEKQRKSQQRISPLTGQQNPGFGAIEPRPLGRLISTVLRSCSGFSTFFPRIVPPFRPFWRRIPAQN